MQIDYTKQFIKSLQKLRPAERQRFIKKLELWLADPGNPILNDHALKGRLAGARSLNVGGDLRAIYRRIDEQHVLFDLIGTHSQLYGK